MSLEVFEKEYEDTAPAGVPVRDVRSKGDDAQVLGSLRGAFRNIQGTLDKNVSRMSEDSVKTFVNIDNNFGEYFKALEEMNKLLEKFTDPEQEATKKDSARLQELLKTEKHLLKGFHDKAKKDDNYQEALLVAQRDTKLAIHDQSFQDKEIQRAARLWDKEHSAMWGTMEQNLTKFSTGFMQGTGADLVGGLFGQEFGFFAKTIAGFVPQMISGVKQIPDQINKLKQTRQTAASIRDRIVATRMLLRNRSVRNVAQSLIKGAVDITDTEFANDLLKAQERLEATQEQLPEELNGTLSQLKDSLDKVAETGEISQENLEEIQGQAQDVLDADDIARAVTEIRDTEATGESLTEAIKEAVPVEELKETRDTEATGRSLTEAIKEAVPVEELKEISRSIEDYQEPEESDDEVLGVLSDIYRTAHTMLLFINDLDEKAGRILAGEIPASEDLLRTLQDISHGEAAATDSVAGGVRDFSHGEAAATDSVAGGVRDLRTEIATNQGLQERIWNVEQDTREATEEHQEGLLTELDKIRKNTRDTARVAGRGGGGGGGAVDGALKYVGGGALSLGGGALLRRVPGGRLLTKLATSRMGAAALGGIGLGGLARVAPAATDAVAGAALKKAPAAIAKVGGKGIFGMLAKGVMKGGAKSLVKKLPVIGLLAGLGFGAKRALDGDFLGAMGEVASGALAMIPGVGTAASIAVDAGMIARDIANETKEDVEAVVSPSAQQYNDDDDLISMDSPRNIQVQDTYQRQLQENMAAEIGRLNDHLQQQQQPQTQPVVRAASSMPPPQQPRRSRSMDDMPVMVDDLGLILVASSKM